MSVETKHPSFDFIKANEFKLLRDSNEGESNIKAKSELYLPKPSGFKAMPDQGKAMYDAYKVRAQFPDILSPTIAAMVGIIHGKEIEIEKPDSLNYIDESATGSGLSLEAFHRRITTELLKIGRYGVLAEAPESGGEPYLCGYAGDAIINWEDDSSFFVIDDSGMVRNGYEWDKEDRYITLEMIEGAYQMKLNIDGQEEIKDIRSTGGNLVDRIPFVVGNAKDVSPCLITPPLIGVSRAALAIYQLSADYRWQLFLSGQETLVAINGDPPNAVGAGVVHSMKGSEGVTPDLKYVSPTCSGIDAHERAMDKNKEAAVMAGAKLIEQEASNGSESGYARKLRFASETATLSTVAKVSCEILQKSLRNLAMLKGLPEAQQNEITVTPPKDLMDTTMSPQDVKALVESWQNGGFSYRTLYENLLRGGVANPERELEDELLELDEAPDAIREAQIESVAS